MSPPADCLKSRGYPYLGPPSTWSVDQVWNVRLRKRYITHPSTILESEEHAWQSISATPFQTTHLTRKKGIVMDSSSPCAHQALGETQVRRGGWTWGAGPWAQWPWGRDASHDCLYYCLGECLRDVTQWKNVKGIWLWNFFCFERASGNAETSETLIQPPFETDPTSYAQKHTDMFVISCRCLCEGPVVWSEGTII